MIILVAVPEGTANRQIIGISYNATQTRKSLVKGERFIRAVWMAEMMPEHCYSSKIYSISTSVLVYQLLIITALKEKHKSIFSSVCPPKPPQKQ